MMSRSGYSDDYDNWANIKWRGQVASAIRGKRGQQFLRDLIHALDNLPVKVLITEDLYRGQYYCAIGAVGLARKVDMRGLDPHDTETVAGKFDIADQLVREIVYENDESSWRWKEQRPETPRERWERMRAWAVARLNKKEK
jgi:hypothetical protein